MISLGEKALKEVRKTVERPDSIGDDGMTTISEFQELMKRTYLHRDEVRGTYATLLWMTSEVGEMLDAILREDHPKIETEAADVFAWLCSTCNLLGVNLEKVSFEKYGGGCPRCHHLPCKCKHK